MVFTHFNPSIASPEWDVSILKRKGRVHCYKASVLSSDYCLEATPDQSGFYMTSCRAGVRRGDLIRIKNANGCSDYQVDEIDFYSDPADMWIAKLHTL